MNQLRAHMKLLTAAGGVGRLAGLAGLGYRAAVPRRCGGRRVCLVTGVAALLAAGVPGACQSVALASSYSILNWTKQHPAASPLARWDAPMAYDAATGNVVLFGGLGGVTVNGTWTWDGATWAKQAPATSPPALLGASMAYDAAAGNVVLFGGAMNLR